MKHCIMSAARLPALVVSISLLSGCSERHFLDYFFTPDQQGRYAMEHRQFARASELFEDPTWKGVAAYRAGNYLDAADSFARVSTADSLFNMGNALVKGREYEKAIPAFEQALVKDPNHIGAKKNLQITQAIIAFLMEAREPGGTEVGADEVRYDNTSGEGQDTVITGPDKLKLESAEQWMRTVDTQPRDFLRTKFALEASRRPTE